MKTLASLMILSFCLVFPLAAQTDKNVEDEIPRSVNEATMIGIGGYNVMDTYLTPGIETKYTGWGVRIQNERMKIVRLADYKVSRQQFLNVEFASTRNAADVATDYVGFVDYSLGYHYRFTNLLPNLKVLTGLSGRLSGGFIYNTRNTNNPASARAYVNLDASGMAIWHLKIKRYPMVLRYQVNLPVMGVLFSPHYGQSYYEIFSLGNAGGVIKFTSLHNQPSLRQMLSIDLPIGYTKMRFSYLADLQQYKVNNIKTHTYSHVFMVGFVKDLYRIRNKKGAAPLPSSVRAY